MDTATRLEIYELLARSAYALDERDLAMLEACFAPDAAMILDIAGGSGPIRFDGRDKIMGLMSDSMKTQTDKRRHVTTNTMVVAEASDAVSLVSNVTITAVENGAIRLVTSGLYRDRVRREAGRWVLSERRIDLDMAY